MTQRGFTLIEVLVALGILAVALAAAMRIYSQASGFGFELRERTLAQWLAQDRMTQHQLMRDWPSPDTTTGTAQYAERDWYWTEQVTQTPNPGLRRVRVEIRATEQGQILGKIGGYLRQPQ